MSDQSMSAYFQQELEEGKTPTDPFEEATKRASTKLTAEQKEMLRNKWNRQIMDNHAARVQNQKKMLGRRAARSFHGRR